MAFILEKARAAKDVLSLAGAGVSTVVRVGTVASIAFFLLLLVASLFFLLQTIAPSLRAGARSVQFPTWAPLEIALVSYLVNDSGVLPRLYLAGRRYGGSLYGLTSTHQVIANLPSADRFMAHPRHTLDPIPHELVMMTRIFGWEGPTTTVSKTIKQLITILERVFLNDAGSTAATERADVPTKSTNFVTFSAAPASLQRWERSADIQYLDPSKGAGDQRPAVEAWLQKLSRDFGACIAIPQLYGQDFLDRNPTLLDDLWLFDNDVFPMLMVGLPEWLPLKVMKQGLAARDRLRKAMQGLFRRIDQYQNGQTVDFDADMTDIGTVALERNKVYASYGLSTSQRGDSDLLTLWAQNANTQPVLFWFLAFIYSYQGSLLEDIRNEVAPYVTIVGNGLMTAMDVPALNHKCPITKAALYETYRLAAEATSIRQVGKPISVEDGQHTHKLRPGTYVSLVHAVSQKDPAVYPSPEEFLPDRFLEQDETTGKRVARYGSLRPWGAGPGICKGRTFAEKELMAAAAAIVSLWDIEAADGVWELPKMIPGTGVKKPVKDIRVVIRHRIVT